MGFLTRCKRLFSFAFLLQNRNTFFSFFLKSFLILSEKQHDSRSVQVCGKETISFDYTGGTLKVEIIVRTPSSVLDNIFIAAQINLGSVALPYEPYQGSLTTLPIPRPLHEVGDVRDVCRTRVKSVYDKRIVLDGTESWKIGSAVGDGAPYIVCDLLSDHYQSDPIVSSRIPYTSISASNKKQGIGGWNRSLYLRYDSLFTNVEELKTYLSAHPLTVYYQSTAYDGTNGLDVCLTEYQTGFAELNGTENWRLNTASGTNYFLFDRGLPNGRFVDNEPTVICDRYKSASYSNRTSPCVYAYDYGGTSLGFADNSYDSVDNWKSYLAAQKAAGTPVQVAYHLATPETYATDPLDIDNAAGPLAIMTGGEVEVRMTELVGSRSPELTAKMDKATYDADGDGVVDRANSVDGGTY